MKKSNFALRLQPSLMEEARKVAKAEGVAVNQLINVAVAEKVSALRTEEYFAERAARGDLKKALQVLKRAGKGNPPLPLDELPAKIPSAGVDRACTRQNQARSPPCKSNPGPMRSNAAISPRSMMPISKVTSNG
jgi:hypothetical protein